jgi:hypothetical protein
MLKNRVSTAKDSSAREMREELSSKLSEKLEASDF